MYVLTVVHPPANGAAFGRAELFPPVGDPVYAAESAITVLLNAPYHPTPAQARQFTDVLLRELPGTQRCHTQTGFVFRIDPADNAPHPCPCGEGEPDGCGRLVLPGDHAFAAMEDAVCSGCWADSVNPGCLPENTAHPIED